ncbi:hypothetical protein K1719_017796 [Acacia pycnantha]|nr:hypothetical protein K1719_017796 [Acacia pycnantha]
MSPLKENVLAILLTAFPEAYTFWEVHGEQRGMRCGLHLPRTSQVGNQVHQDDPVNEVVRDAFGVQDDNFTPSSGVEQLKDLGCKWVILGHSERRHIIGENDEVKILRNYFQQLKAYAVLEGKKGSWSPHITIESHIGENIGDVTAKGECASNIADLVKALKQF